MRPSTSYAHAKRLNAAIRQIFYCPACSLWRSTRKAAGCARVIPSRRKASTLVSTTAVNATKSIPPRNKDLYEALNDLKKKAYGQVNLSRLQLAIQGLESEQPTTRVALLGVDASATARRLARLLLADSSKPQQGWETRLVADDVEHESGFIIRYGTPRNEALQTPPSALPVFLIPAPLLQSRKVEILVSSVRIPEGNGPVSGSIPSDALLSPPITTPTSADGRHVVINQPVHRAIISAKGFDQLIKAAELLAGTKFTAPTERSLIDVVVVDTEGRVDSSSSTTITVDASRAEKGLQVVREDIGHAAEYEKSWVESGMSALSKSLANSATVNGGGLPQPSLDLIASLLEITSANIESQAQEARQFARSKTLAATQRVLLENAISSFTRQGHAELQVGLATAWSSRNWRKLAFWKLFWRVDDVPLIVTDLVTTAWLPRTERAIFELCGRFQQAGIPLPRRQEFVTVSATKTSPRFGQDMARDPALAAVQDGRVLASSAPAETVSTPLLPPASPATQPSSIPFTSPFLASTISDHRQTFLTAAITTLTSSAQQIVLKALTISGVSATLSALSYLSVTSGSIYESATIVALGTAYALRRMQKEWDTQCQELEDGLMVEGRSVLKQTEEHMGRLVEDASRVVEDEVELQTRDEVIKAVDRARVALQKLQ